jgi:hypothetical protein
MSYIACIAFILMIAIAPLRPAFSQTGEWRQFFTNSSGDEFFYDAQNLAYSNQRVTVTVKAINKTGGTGAKSITHVIEFDCEKTVQRRLETRIERSDGSIQTDSRPQNWAPGVPGTWTDMLPELVCKKQIFHRKQAR